MALTTMYEGMNNSPQTDITAAITASDTVIPVSSVSVFPAAPNLATLGSDENAEVIRYNGIDGSTLTGCERGFGGTTASPWAAGTVISRQITKYDLDTLARNIIDLNTRKLETMDATPTSGSTNPVQSNGIATAINQVATIANGKVSKSGDTMTGNLTFKTILDPGTSSNSNFGTPVLLMDKNLTEIGRLQIAQDDNVYSDTRRLGLFTYRTVNGVDVTNGIQIGVDASGNKRYKVSDEKQFCYDVLTHEILRFTNKATNATSSSAVFCTITDDKITANHVVTDCTFSTPTSITADVTWNTYDGYMTLTGINSSASNTVSVTLGFAGNL